MILKCLLINIIWGCRSYSIGSDSETVTGSCENGTEPLEAIKGGDISEYTSDYWLLNTEHLSCFSSHFYVLRALFFRPLSFIPYCDNRSKSLSISCQPLTTESQFWSQANPFGICKGKICSAAGFLRALRVLPCQYHSSVSPRSYLIHLPPVQQHICCILSKWCRG